MRARWLLGTASILLGLLLGVQGPYAHPGGLDSKGGHFNRKTGEYHIHRPAGGQTPPRRPPTATGLVSEGSPEASGAAGLPESLRDVTAARKVDALLAVLLRRGVVTESELAAELARLQ